MGLRWTCDGCEHDCDETKLVLVGRLAQKAYCRDCIVAYHTFQAAEREARLDAIRVFETALRNARAAAKQTLKALPDE